MKYVSLDFLDGFNMKGPTLSLQNAPKRLLVFVISYGRLMFSIRCGTTYFAGDFGQGVFAPMELFRYSVSATVFSMRFPCVGSFTSSGIDTRKNGPSAFSVSSEIHRQIGMNEIALVSIQQ